ncbi:MAG TPA: HEAT repeat domain-containing protein [Pirellulales bacterium]|nr:HEAT repeat domain-containing protein [Pirellulales bacterium]
MPSVEELADQLNSGDQPAVYRAKRALSEMVAAAGAPGKAGERAGLAAALAKAEVARNEKGDAPKHGTKARDEIARALADVAGDMEVPALKSTLGDFDSREMARFALDRMTCQAATDALADAALNSVGIEFRVGAINALARRRGSQVIDVLKACAGDNDPEVHLAAAEALANHADASAETILRELAKHAAAPRAQLRLAKARVRLAARLASAGQKDAARQIYQSILDNDAAAAAQKRAAGTGLAQLG